MAGKVIYFFMEGQINRTMGAFETFFTPRADLKGMIVSSI